jgi:hypothetical protein
MTMKIDIIRFFKTKVEPRDDDHWVEYETNWAVDAGGANETQASDIIRKELARKDSSGRPKVDPLPPFGKPESSHVSLDLVEPESRDTIAYVIKLPPRDHTRRAGEPGILHPETDLKFGEPPFEPTRIHPKVKNEFRIAATMIDDKTAWFVIDRNAMKNSDVGKALAALGLEQMVVPIGLNIFESVLGVSPWVLPRKKDGSAITPAKWHGGPHPPDNPAITVNLKP